MNKFFYVVLTGLCLSGVSAVASAQWIWKDDSGHTVISDQPPPISVPKSRIVRSPNGSANSSDVSSAPVTDTAATSTQKSLAEQNLEFNKRMKENAEAAKKQADEAAKSAQKAQNCAAAQSALAGLQSGQRITSVDSTGQRYYLDDSQRAAEIQRVQASAQGC